MKTSSAAIILLGYLVLPPPVAASSQMHLLSNLTPLFCASCRPRVGGSDSPFAWELAQLYPSQPSMGSIGGWHLVRTPGPEKAVDVVSIMHAADLMQSDPQFAGISLRCRPKASLQVAFVVITPFRPRTQPKVVVTVNQSKKEFKADVVPPGSMIVLPDEAEVLAKGPWQTGKELKVDIGGDDLKIHGVVSLENLHAAISQLQASCP